MLSLKIVLYMVVDKRGVYCCCCALRYSVQWDSRLILRRLNSTRRCLALRESTVLYCQYSTIIQYLSLLQVCHLFYRLFRKQSSWAPCSMLRTVDERQSLVLLNPAPFLCVGPENRRDLESAHAGGRDHELSEIFDLVCGLEAVM